MLFNSEKTTSLPKTDIRLIVDALTITQRHIIKKHNKTEKSCQWEKAFC